MDDKWTDGAHVTLSFPEVSVDTMERLYSIAIEAGVPFRMYVNHSIPTT